MLCWTSSKMEASDWSKFVCYTYLAATTTLIKRNCKKIYNISVKYNAPSYYPWSDTLWIASPAIQYPRCLERPRSRTWTCPAPVSTRTRPRAPRSCRRSGRRTTSSGASPPWPRSMQRTSMQPRKKRGKRKR